MLKLSANQRSLVAGLDEAGCGPLAGPVTAACVVLTSQGKRIPLNDSKKLKSSEREELFERIIRNSFAYAVVSVGPRRIETLNIREAARRALSLAAARVQRQLETQQLSSLRIHYLIDGIVPIDPIYSQETIIKGDEFIPAIQAASIVAKVSRDRLMERLEQYYPGYGFSIHKGYGTRLHCEQIRERGPSIVHRRTFTGVKEFISG